MAENEPVNIGKKVEQKENEWIVDGLSVAALAAEQSEEVRGRMAADLFGLTLINRRLPKSRRPSKIKEFKKNP